MSTSSSHILQPELAPLSAQANAPETSSGGSPSTTALGTAGQAVQKCLPAVRPAAPAAPDVNADRPGLFEAVQASNYYTIYGNTTGQIASQVDNCTPVIEGAEHFAASTDYAINWSFRYQSNESGLCVITSVAVGLSIAQTYPAWQPGSGVSSATKANWQRFMTNLAIHENGHADLSRTYAAVILSDLQNFPATECGSILGAANAKADVDLAALNQANDDYDTATGHGTTQGATLN